MEPFNLAQAGACTLQVHTTTGNKVGVQLKGFKRDDDNLPYGVVAAYSLNGEHHSAADDAKLRLAQVDDEDVTLDNLSREHMVANATVTVSEGVFAVLNPGGDARTVQFQVQDARTA